MKRDVVYRRCIMSSAGAVVPAAMFLLFGASAWAREITNLDVSADGATATVAMTAGEDGETNAVYYAWSNDGADKGADIAAWPHVCRVGRVGEIAGDFTFALPPPAAVSPQYAARVFLATSDKKYDYLVDGITSAGKAYIDTGVTPQGGKTSLIMDFKLSSNKASQYLFGVWKSNYFSFCGYVNSSQGWSFVATKSTSPWTALGQAATTERTIVSLDASLSPAVFSISNATVNASKSATASATSAAPGHLFLFTRNDTTKTANPASGTLYACSITNEGDCVRNYVPCVSGGKAGLYDAAKGTFTRSAVTTDFTAGTNTTYFVVDGDVVVAESPSWTQATTDYVIATPYIETTSIVSASGGSKSGAAPLVLSGANDWGGSFTNNEGALIADFGQGLASTDELILNGGVYGILTGDVFNWLPGGGPGRVSVADGVSAFGFSTYRHPFAVVANGDADAPLEYGTASSTHFNPATFVMNDGYATDTLTLMNGVVGCNSDGTVPTLTIQTGAATAVVERAVADLNLAKTGAGTLVLTGTNAFGTVNVSGGGRLLATTSVGAATVATNTSSGAIAVSGTGSCLEMRDSVWNSSGALNVTGGANGATPAVIIDNAALTVSSMTVGAHGGAVGYLTLQNNASLTVSGSSDFTFRRGTVTQRGGTVSLYSLKMATGYTYGLNYHVYGGKLRCRMSGEGGFYLGYASGTAAPSATMNVYEGAEVEIASSDPSLGRYAGTTDGKYNRGFLNIYGGSFSVVRTGLSRATFYVGYSGSGGLLVSNGLFRVDGGVVALQNGNAGRSATVRILNGGVAKVDYIRKKALEGDTRSSVLELDGGRIVAQSANANFVSGFLNASVGTGGFEVDTAGLALAASQSFAARDGQTWTEGATADELLSEAAFTVVGGGRLALTGTNEWLCATCVSNSTLAVGEKALPAGTLRLDGGVIDLGGFTHTVTNLVGSGVVSNGTLVVAGTTYPGWADGGTLVIAANATLSTTNIAYSVKSETGSCGCIEAKGAIDVDGAVISVEGVELIGRRGVRLVKGAPVVGTPVPAAGQALPLSVGRSSVGIGLPGTMLIWR